MPSISASKNATLRTCPRLYYWSYVRHLEMKDIGGARDFGTMFHAGLEAWWNHAGQGDVPWKQIDIALVEALKAIHAKGSTVSTNKYDIARAEAMMCAYHAIYSDLEFELVGKTGTEEWFRSALRDFDGKEVPGWTIVGRTDVMSQFDARPQGMSIVEHKSVASTTDLAPQSRYWEGVRIDAQAPLYVEAARAAGLNARDVMWDACRKPNVSPELETPMHEREMTKGKGCKACGGTASGDIVKGTGVVPEATAGAKSAKRKRAHKVNSTDDDDSNPFTTSVGGSPVPEPGERCPECDGEGWKKLEPLPDGTPQYDAPKYKAFVNERDETVEDFKARCTAAIAADPLAHFVQKPIEFSDDELRNARADLVAATVEIDAFVTRARHIADGNLLNPEARFGFPMNRRACLSMYGRPCDFFSTCHRGVEPEKSELFQIKPKQSP